MTAIAGVDPSTGLSLPPVVRETDSGHVESAVAATHGAKSAYAALTRAQRADILELH